MRGLAPVAATISVLGALGGIGVAVFVIGQGARAPNASTLLITFVVSLLTALVGGVVTVIVALAERSTVSGVVGGVVVVFCLVSMVLLVFGGIPLLGH